MEKKDILDIARKEVLNHLTGNNPEGDFEFSTIGAEDKIEWWVRGYERGQLSNTSNFDDVRPLQELLDTGYDPYDTSHHLQVQHMLKVIEQFITKKNKQ